MVVPVTVLVTLPAVDNVGAAAITNERLAPVTGVLVLTITRSLPSTLALKPMPAALILAARPAAISARGTASRTTITCVLDPRFKVTVSPALGAPPISTVPPSIAAAAPAPLTRVGMLKVAVPSTAMVSPRLTASNAELSLTCFASAASTSASDSPAATTWSWSTPPTLTRHFSPATGMPRATPTVAAVAAEAASAKVRATP